MTIQDLQAKYPELFTVTDPSYPFLGVYIEDGWLPLVDTLLGVIQDERHIITQLDPSENLVYIQQIKQKFGKLRLYTAKTFPRIQGAIALAEALSGKICEKCGSPGSMRNNNGYYHVACDSCNEK